MEIYLVKQDDNSFKVAHDSDYEKIQKIPIGKQVLCKVTQPRNLAFHNKFMALIRMVYENQEHYNNFDHLRKDLIIGAGFYDEHVSFDGEVVREAKSVSFGKMSEFEFKELYNRVLDQIVLHFHFDNDLIMKNVNNYM